MYIVVVFSRSCFFFFLFVCVGGFVFMSFVISEKNHTNKMCVFFILYELRAKKKKKRKDKKSFGTFEKKIKTLALVLHHKTCTITTENTHTYIKYVYVYGNVTQQPPRLTASLIDIIRHDENPSRKHTIKWYEKFTLFLYRVLNF